MDDIDIADLDAAELLARLYNAARPVGLGVLQDAERGGKKMDREEAQRLLAGGHERWGARNVVSFDYLYGRPLKLAFEYDDASGRAVRLCRADLYDRDQGPGLCQQIVDDMRSAA
jgi:hypothetical protein